MTRSCTRYLHIAALLLLVTSALQAQPIVQKRYNAFQMSVPPVPIPNATHSYQCVDRTSDGGMIIASQLTFTDVTTRTRIHLMKTDSNGTVLWSKILGDSRDTEIDAHLSPRCIKQTEDGGFIIAGVHWSWNPAQAEAALIKTDGSGNTTWLRVVTYPFYPRPGEGLSVTELPEANPGQWKYAMTGWMNSSTPPAKAMFLLLATTGGTTFLHEITLGEGQDGVGQSITTFLNNGSPEFLITGSYADRLAVLRITPGGFVTWARQIPASFPAVSSCGYSIAMEGPTDAVLAGAYGADACFGKITTGGVLNCGLIFGTPGATDCIYSVQPTGREYLLCGFTDFNTLVTMRDVYLASINPNCTIRTTRTIQGTNNDEARSSVMAADGTYIFTGYTESYGAAIRDVLLIRENVLFSCEPPLPVQEASFNIDNLIAGSNNPHTVATLPPYAVEAETASNNISVCEFHNFMGNPGGEQEKGSMFERPQYPAQEHMLSVVPNPSNEQSTVSYSVEADGMVRIELYNSLGAHVDLVFEGYKTKGQYSLDYTTARLTSGAYHIRMTVNGMTRMIPMMVVH